MLIRTISDERAIELIREWNGQTPGGKVAESERLFQTMCDRFVLVEVESFQELRRLNAMEKYITGGHAFYLYVRYPIDVLDAVRSGRAAMPSFVHRAEDRYTSAYTRGNLRLLLGFLQEAMDPGYDLGLFGDIIDEQRRKKEAARRAAWAAAHSLYQQEYQQQVYQQPAYQPEYQQEAAQQPVYQEAPRQPAYQQPTPQQAAYQQPAVAQPPVRQPRERRASNVVHFHFGNQVS